MKLCKERPVFEGLRFNQILDRDKSLLEAEFSSEEIWAAV